LEGVVELRALDDIKSVIVAISQRLVRRPTERTANCVCGECPDGGQISTWTFAKDNSCRSAGITTLPCNYVVAANLYRCWNGRELDDSLSDGRDGKEGRAEDGFEKHLGLKE